MQEMSNFGTFCQFYRLASKLNTKPNSPLVPLFSFLIKLTVKIPDRKQLYPKKWTCILWCRLRDWNSRPYYLIVIHNLTLYLSNISVLMQNVSFCVDKINSVQIKQTCALQQFKTVSIDYIY